MNQDSDVQRREEGVDEVADLLLEVEDYVV